VALLKKWLATDEETPACEPTKLTFFPVLEADTAESSSAENEQQLLQARLVEARRLLAGLHAHYKERVPILERDERLSAAEAHKRAMVEVTKTTEYRRWRVLG
jgi:hypothetical protein